VPGLVTVFGFRALVSGLAAYLLCTGALAQAAACMDLDGIPPGLYAEVRSGKAYLEKDNKRIELGPGQVGFADLDRLECIDEPPRFLDWPCASDAARSRAFATYDLSKLANGDRLEEIVGRYFSVPEIPSPAINWLAGETHGHFAAGRLAPYNSGTLWYQPAENRALLSGERPRTLLVSLYLQLGQALVDSHMWKAMGASESDGDLPVTFVFHDSNTIPIGALGEDANLQQIIETFFQQDVKLAPVPMWWQGDHHLKVPLGEFERYFDIPPLESVDPARRAALKSDLDSGGLERKPIFITLMSESGTVVVDQPDRVRVAGSLGMERLPVVLNFVESDTLLAACGPGFAQGMGAVVGAAAPGYDANYHTVDIFYGTDRARGESDEPAEFYTGERGELELGMARVSIPLDHELGELESPSFFRLEFVEDPEKHIVLLAVEADDREDFIDELRWRIENSDEKSAFVFVHGYNVTFEDAARRTAQLAYDLQFTGAPILYSWPSKGSLLGYFADEASVQYTETHLTEFLRLVREQSGAEIVHLIGHSMGNRALTAALREIGRDSGGPVFNQIALVAPDIDADYFRNAIAPQIVPAGRRLTLYASATDEALAASHKAHDAPRAGDAGEVPVIVPGIDTIDVTGLDTSLLGHSYFAENESVIADLIKLLSGDTPPAGRSGLQQVTVGSLVYWRFVLPE